MRISSIAPRLKLLLGTGLLFVSTTNLCSATEPHPLATVDVQVYTEGQKPDDPRQQTLIDLNGHFPFHVPASIDAWEERAEQLRHRILVASGMWPQPAATAMNPVIHGKVVRDGFTVEKVYLESVPGHFVSGLLFRPEKTTAGQKHPAVLCPHGHGGRLEDMGEQGVRRAIAQGFERFESSGRFPALARCAQLARMGCVTFIYDMIGYGDSQQIPFEVAHRAAQRRPEMETKENWGFYSPMAELRLQSIMGLQMLNSVRSLDFLASLPDVDPARIAVTGNSGGGTQTLLLCAIDSRPIAEFPNGMVSTSMQGGCYCENAPLLRIGTGNVELAALFAPKPIGMTAVDDWTRDMMTDGYPEMKKLYAMYGKEDNVLCKHYPHFPHNYNYVTRCLMYSFFNKHMQLGQAEPIVEEDYRLLSPEEYTVWNEDHPKPAGGPEHERSILRGMTERSDQQLAQLREENWNEYQQVVRTAYDVIVGRSLPTASQVAVESLGRESQTDLIIEKLEVQYTPTGERVPCLVLRRPQDSDPSGATLWLDGYAKANILDSEGKLVTGVQQQLDQGRWIVAIDLFGYGENAIADQPADRQRLVNDSRPYAAFTFGYNSPLMSQQIADVLTTIAAIRQKSSSVPLHIVAKGAAAPVAAIARMLTGGTVNSAHLDTDGFRFANVPSFGDPRFLPGAVKYGDLPIVLALNAPHSLTLVGETAAEIKAAYERSGASAQLKLNGKAQ